MDEINPVPGGTLQLQRLNSLKINDVRQEERIDRITRLAQRSLHVPIALFSFFDENRVWLMPGHGIECPEIPRRGALFGYERLYEIVCVVPDTTKDTRFRDNPLVTKSPGVRFYASCPVRAQDGSPLGALCVLDTLPRQPAAQDTDLLLELAQMIEDELSTLAMATTDELTGLANRRGFRIIAEPMIALCRRNWQSATVVTCDLDGLKQINDDFGHETGDAAIRDFGRLLLKVFRDSDVVARVGGDEFCVLLTNQNDADLSGPLDRLQRRVESYNAECGQRPYSLSFSAGAVGFNPGRHASVDDLLNDADRQMYFQKRSKCNRPERALTGRANFS